YGFADIIHVEETLRALRERDEALVVDLGRQPGQKESRYAHLLCGEVEIPESGIFAPTPTAAGSNRPDYRKEIDELKADVEALKVEFEQFKSQFD
ncbi:MAG: DUF480 domain-containing protein, partial [Acidobacteriota bacterium]|nr:DUF480 domain-containing protein [Acidobacteriota bacterium]